MSRDAEVVLVGNNDDRRLVEFGGDAVMVGEIVEDEETPDGHIAVIVYVNYADILDGTV